MMVDEDADPEDAIAGPGNYELTWRRYVLVFPLPSFPPFTSAYTQYQFRWHARRALHLDLCAARSHAAT
jgi:hypothetical protein